MSVRIEQYDGYIALDPDGVWAKSEFPDELLTVDLNAQGGVIGIEAIGSVARSGIDAMFRALAADAAFASSPAAKALLQPVA